MDGNSKNHVEKRNSEHYMDITAYLALSSIERDERQSGFYSNLSKSPGKKAVTQK